MRHLLLGLLLASMILALPQREASAQQAPYDCTDVESCARLGTELFQAEHFLEAALVLEYAYQIDPVDVLMYNIARAYQRGNRCVRASSYFRRYLESGDTQAREQAIQHEPGQTECAERYHGLILQAEAALDAQDLVRTQDLVTQARNLSDEPEARLLQVSTLLLAPSPENCQIAQSSLTEFADLGDYNEQQRTELQADQNQVNQCLNQQPPAGDRSQCETDRQQRDAEWRQSVKTRRLIGYIVGGAGVAVLAGALIHDIASQGLIDDYEAAAAAGNGTLYNQYRDDLSSAKTLSIVLYAVGVATTAAGVVLWLTAGGSSPADDIDCSALAWDFGYGLPTGDAGLWFRGTF